MGRDRYRSFSELRRRERLGEDYRIARRLGPSGFAIVAPHGGEIEPGTSEIADDIAGDSHSYYALEGLKPERNRDLHITSVNYDEPGAMALVAVAETVVTVHGCRDRDETAYLGGLDERLEARVGLHLERAGFLVARHADPRLHGVSRRNICNRGTTGRGVQLELSTGLRRRMFGGLDRPGRGRRTRRYGRFVDAVRRALEPASGPAPAHRRSD